MAEDGEEQLECILCDKTIVPGTERVVKEAAIKRFCDASLVHEDNKHKIMSGKKELVIHVNCHSKYLRTDKIQDQKNLARCSRRRSTIEARLFEFNKFCFFCGDDACDEVIQRQQKEFGKAFVKIRRVEKEDTIKHVIEELETRKTLSKLDDQCKIIYSRLNGMKDILKMNPQYHISCHISFYNFSITKDKGRPKNDTITDAVYFVIDYLESNSEDCQFSLKSILNKFEKNEGLDLRYIKRKIESEINDCVIIYPSDNDYIICYRKVTNILSNDWYTVKCENREDERKRLVKLAGSIILQDILSMKYDLDKYPSPSNFLEESQSLIPQTLKIFLDIIIKENKKSVKFTDRLENKV